MSSVFFLPCGSDSTDSFLTHCVRRSCCRSSSIRRRCVRSSHIHWQAQAPRQLRKSQGLCQSLQARRSGDCNASAVEAAGNMGRPHVLPCSGNSLASSGVLWDRCDVYHQRGADIRTLQVEERQLPPSSAHSRFQLHLRVALLQARLSPPQSSGCRYSSEFLARSFAEGSDPASTCALQQPCRVHDASRTGREPSLKPHDG